MWLVPPVTSQEDQQSALQKLNRPWVHMPSFLCICRSRTVASRSDAAVKGHKGVTGGDASYLSVQQGDPVTADGRPRPAQVLDPPRASCVPAESTGRHCWAPVRPLTCRTSSQETQKGATLKEMFSSWNETQPGYFGFDVHLACVCFCSCE